jgi:hypothetical protein
MTLAKLTLFSCPLALAALVLFNSPAVASPVANLLQANASEFTTEHPAAPVAVAPPSDRPLLPTGCACARCTKAEQLLQGQLPVF